MSTAAIASNLQNTPRVTGPKAQSAAAPAKSPSVAVPTSSPPAHSSASVASAVVNAAAATIKEVTETSAQTAKEASQGDRQAQTLLAKEGAARAGGVSTSSKAISTKGGRLSVKA
jgi:hypothetical protein